MRQIWNQMSTSMERLLNNFKCDPVRHPGRKEGQTHEDLFSIVEKKKH